VLHLESAEGGAFGGFESAADAREFDTMLSQWLLGGWSGT
jgi:hypothetical protein